MLLTGAQQNEVLVMLGSTTPNDHGHTNSPFWSTRILATLIDQKYSVVYSSRTSYYVLFKKASFSFHLPGKQYEKADAEVVVAWEKERYTRPETGSILQRSRVDGPSAGPRRSVASTF